jgi:hypothetical protein
METTETPQQLVTRATNELSRCGSDPDTAEAAFGLMGLDAAAEKIRETTELVVERMRANGATWERIGTALGVTRSAAQQRFRHL